MKISQLLTKESKWCKGALARDKNGKPINCLDIKYFDKGGTIDFGKNAVAYSLMGAISHCYFYDDHDSVLEKLHQAMRTVLRKDMSVADFNNHEQTRFEILKEVIAEAGV
jgi:hypothetical protein